MELDFGTLSCLTNGQPELTDHTVHGMTKDCLPIFGMGKEKWSAIRDARLDLVEQRYGWEHPSIRPILKMLDT